MAEGGESSEFALLQPDGGSPNGALPVVVLMGWVGAQRDGALLKYAEFFAARGYPSVRSVQPTPTAFSPLPGPKRRWALALLSYLQAQGLWPQRRLVLYAFSNGGGFVVEQLQLLAESGDPLYAQLRASIAGFVFDSAPAYMAPGTLGRVVAETEPPSLGRLFRTAYYNVTWLLARRHWQAYWGNMRRLGWGRPQLFFYSIDDPLCDGPSLDELLAEKRADGQRVASRRWLRSEHCGHFKRHREEYAAALLEFLEDVQADAAAAAAWRRPASAAGGQRGGGGENGAAVGPRARL